MCDTDDDVTDVIFKREGTDIVAFFPALAGSQNAFSVSCYSHREQHSAASTDYVGVCKPAKPDEYAALKAELEARGYNLRVVRRMTQRHATLRAKSFK